MGNLIPRGSFATSMENFAAEIGISRKTLLKWLDRFEAENQITREGNNRYTVITVINYAKYQDCYSEGLQQDSQQELHQGSQQGLQQGLHNRTKKQRNKETNINTFVPPTVEEVREYCQERNNRIDPDSFVNFYESKGWLIGKNRMKDWKAAVRTWEKNRSGYSKKQDSLPSYYNSNPKRETETKPMTAEELREAQERLKRMKQ